MRGFAEWKSLAVIHTCELLSQGYFLRPSDESLLYSFDIPPHTAESTRKGVKHNTRSVNRKVIGKGGNDALNPRDGTSGQQTEKISELLPWPSCWKLQDGGCVAGAPHRPEALAQDNWSMSDHICRPPSSPQQVWTRSPVCNQESPSAVTNKEDGIAIWAP